MDIFTLQILSEKNNEKNHPYKNYQESTSIIHITV